MIRDSRKLFCSNITELIAIERWSLNNIQSQITEITPYEMKHMQGLMLNVFQ